METLLVDFAYQIGKTIKEEEFATVDPDKLWQTEKTPEEEQAKQQENSLAQSNQAAVGGNGSDNPSETKKPKAPPVRSQELASALEFMREAYSADERVNTVAIEFAPGSAEGSGRCDPQILMVLHVMKSPHSFTYISVNPVGDPAVPKFPGPKGYPESLSGAPKVY